MRPWAPYILDRVPLEVLDTYARIKGILFRLPAVDLGEDGRGRKIILSCHMLCRALAAVVPKLVVEEGQFAEIFSHAWLRVGLPRYPRYPGPWIIDVCPVGMLGGPILVDAYSGISSPGSVLYKKGEVRAKLLGFKSRPFSRSVRLVTKAVEEIAKRQVPRK